MKVLNIIILILFKVGCFAQAIDWVQTLPQVSTWISFSTSDQLGNIYILSSPRQLTKLDPTGKVLKQYSFPNNIDCNKILIRNNQLLFIGSVFGSLTFAGTTFTSTGVCDAFIGGFDLNFNESWVKWYGGKGMDYGETFCADPNGNVYYTFSFKDTVQFEGSDYYFSSKGGAVLCMTDQQNNHVWTMACEGNGTMMSLINGLEINKNNELLITGAVSSINDFKLNGNSHSVILTPEPNLEGGVNYAVKLNSAFQKVWSKCWQNGYYDFTQVTGHTSTNAFIIKGYGGNGCVSTTLTILDHQGNIVNTKPFTGHPSCRHQIDLLGIVDDEAYFFHKNHQYQINNSPLQFSVVRNNDLQPLLYFNGDMYRSWFLKTPQNNYYLCGLLSGVFKGNGADICTDTSFINSNGIIVYDDAVILAKLHPYQQVLLTEQVHSNNKFTVYPSVTSGELYLKGERSSSFNTLRIYDSLGRLLIQESGSDIHGTLNVSMLASGLYIIQIDEEAPLKFIRQ